MRDLHNAGVLDVAGQTLEYALIAPRRAGPTMVLLHEGLGCVAMWKDFPAALAAATGLGVFSYSRAGYGGSSAVALPRPLDFHTRDALEVLPQLLDRADIGPSVLVGHSDGASIAIIYAGASGDTRVRGLALIAPHVFTEDRCVSNIRATIAAYASGPLRERLARYHGRNVECAFRGWSETWIAPAFAGWNIEHHLGGIRVPVLTLRGDDDPYNTPAHVERIAAAAGGAVETVSLAACGHAPHVEQPQLVLAHLARFVTALDATPRP